ncbi:MAG: hypothetical protein Q7R34_02800 [Dehalococcoidia bacterium]|nr:hypothetical protein [Dehalococcoidia bacterium]
MSLLKILAVGGGIYVLVKALAPKRVEAKDYSIDTLPDVGTLSPDKSRWTVEHTSRLKTILASGPPIPIETSFGEFSLALWTPEQEANSLLTDALAYLGIRFEDVPGFGASMTAWEALSVLSPELGITAQMETDSFDSWIPFKQKEYPILKQAQVDNSLAGGIQLQTFDGPKQATAAGQPFIVRLTLSNPYDKELSSEIRVWGFNTGWTTTNGNIDLLPGETKDIDFILISPALSPTRKFYKMPILVQIGDGPVETVMDYWFYRMEGTPHPSAVVLDPAINDPVQYW